MNERELLERELRAARNELIRKQSRDSEEPFGESKLPLMPDRDEEFLRLGVMTADELEEHIESLERDLSDLDFGFETPKKDN